MENQAVKMFFKFPSDSNVQAILKSTGYGVSVQVWMSEFSIGRMEHIEMVKIWYEHQCMGKSEQQLEN